jgi:tRNA modification GTPase
MWEAMTNSTIFAPSSGQGRAGIAVIRISGPGAGPALEAFTGRLTPPEHMVLSRFADPETSEVLDRGYAVWFPGPKSFTGEDVAEFHLHGSPAVIDAVLAALNRVTDCRPADAGEFTRRALDNGKLDLVELEGLADLINAQTQGQRRQAQHAGALAALYEEWRGRLIGILAHLEAGLDFSDEEDVPDAGVARLLVSVAAIAGDIERHLNDERMGERLRQGLSVVIAGVPNAGKSSLMNRLARRDVAIVSTRAGTTRDVIEVNLDLDGVPVALVDTAGIHDASDDIEREGVRRALARADQADLVIWVIDGGKPAESQFKAAGQIDSEPLFVLNKTDLAEDATRDRKVYAAQVSAKTGAGLDQLISWLAEKARTMAGTGEDLHVTRARHRTALSSCADHLKQAVGNPGKADELIAEDIRLAVRQLGVITGRVDVEEVLDAVFGEFCIGK